MALKHIENADNAADLEAARKSFKIDVAIEAGLMPPQLLAYIEYLEHEWSAEHYQAAQWCKKYLDLKHGK